MDFTIRNVLVNDTEKEAMNFIMILLLLSFFSSCKVREDILEIEYQCKEGKKAVHKQKVYNPHIWCNEHFSKALTEIMRACPEITIHASFCGSK